MTIFCGAFALHPGVELPAALLDGLRTHVSRSPADRPLRFDAGSACVVSVDIGAFAGSGALDRGEAGFAVVAGEPMLGADGEGHERGADLARISASLRSATPHAALRQAAGTFCGVDYDAATRTMTVFVDKCGVRPVYVWAGPEYVVFASALRILEALAEVPKEFDMRGVTEIAALGYALGERTPFRNIAMLRAGEALRLSDGRVQREQYWRWDGPLDGIGYEAAARRAYDAFLTAIVRRQRGERVAAAFLSGGLDSRVIVGGLAALDCDVRTVNYAPDGSQDQVFARLVAEQLGLTHTQIETNADNVGQGYRKDAVNAWIRQTYPELTAAGKAPVLWSGDGGSVGLGYVYMTPEIVAAMERGATSEAITLFTRGVPQRIFRRSVVGSIANLTHQGVAEELAALEGPDQGRRFQLFLMLNDQRRHLAQHFEDIDLERIEFHLPFFDADFLDSVLRLPNAWLMGHRFYMDWMAHFPNALTSIPWQAYPGHIPCTLPSPPGLKYQWDVYYDKKMYAQMRRSHARSGYSMLSSARFPGQLISRGTLRLASLLTGAGVRDYSYLIKTAGVYHRYWSRTQESAHDGQAA
ncbi:asparagine synthetase B family protein [uncultured Massilia sp.]|uniref:asparagine synthase-related protein n=1 Tax=uncultured Massilia sp. TaxID=169973 RepID=UPI00258DB9AE|nr:asparagine synthetase B family protein [uncultured Massilia sp.]